MHCSLVSGVTLSALHARYVLELFLIRTVRASSNELSVTTTAVRYQRLISCKSTRVEITL
jgi:hypothetical protein